MTKEDLESRIGQTVWFAENGVDKVQHGTVPKNQYWSGSDTYALIDDYSGVAYDDYYVNLCNIFPTETAAWEEKKRRAEAEIAQAKRWIAVQRTHIRRANRRLKRIAGAKQ